MKTSIKFPVTVFLSCMFLLLSCNKNDGEVRESSNLEVTIEYQIEFTAEYEGPDGTISIHSEDGPLKIFVGDKVTFLNTSKLITIIREEGVEISREEKPYLGEVVWVFETGIIENPESPNDTEQTSGSFNQDEAVIVRYDKPDNSGGPYLILAVIAEDTASGNNEEFFLEFVEVTQ